MRCTLVSLFIFCLGICGMASAAHGEGAFRDPRVAFAETDTNGDGQIDRAEFHARMVEIFFHGDRDKNGYMTWAELEAVVALPNDFRGADRNGDGRYSLHEFIRVRFDDYDVVDTDEDGLLSLNEVVTIFERGGVR
jgi:Ca2+-binding EF-hand superfamily protein